MKNEKLNYYENIKAKKNFQYYTGSFIILKKRITIYNFATCFVNLDFKLEALLS